MKLEFLVLVNNDDSFCNSKRAFVDFLKVESLISISGQKLTFKRTLKSKSLITVKFRVETGTIPSNTERYFLVVLENTNESLVDEFSEVGNKIKEICKRINPESTLINVLWDDVGKYYAYKAYPLINDVENLMRKLISKFMLINVGMEWSKDNIHPELAKKIERFDEEDVHLNDLYKLDFINLSDVLFQKKRDLSLDELDRVLSKTKFLDGDKNKILKFLPRSNWEKYFSSLLGVNAQSLEAKWGILYKLRNKVAHNRFLTRGDFEKIKGVTNEVNQILKGAIDKLGEIDLDEEDRELIIHGYHSNSPFAYSYVAEKAVAEYFMQNGLEIIPTERRYPGYSVDFIVKEPGSLTAVDVHSVPSRMPWNIFATRLERSIIAITKAILTKSANYGEIVLVFRDYPESIFLRRYFDDLSCLGDGSNENIKIKFGALNELNDFQSLELNDLQPMGLNEKLG
ncbi:hypothetical protein ACQYD5_002966 [Serratia marcescens]